MAGVDLAIRLLGPVELWRDGAAVPAGGPTQRAVLAMLALRIGQPVSATALSDGVWGEADEPAGAAKAMQVHVARLRSVLRSGKRQPLQSVPGGYRLDGDQLAVDAAAFERGVADGRRLLGDSQLAPALEQLDAALGLWRGPALMDLRDFPFAAHAADRYEELRVDAAEQAIAARLALGEAQALVPQLQSLIAEHPYRERLHAQLMTALYRAGQQAAALDAYTAARSRLVLDLGIEPGPELQTLQRRILAQDPELTAPAAAAAETTAPISAPVTRASRPPPAPELFGREALLAELADIVKSRRRLVTLTGAGGSGKTSLALAFAHRLTERYSDGVAFVDLAAVSVAEQVLPALAAAMGISPQVGSVADQLATILAERRMLVVLDNCEHLLAAVPDLAPLVDATGGLILATSRSPLGLRAEHLVPVPPLPAPDPDGTDLASEPAVALFVRAAANAGVTLRPDELPAVANICRAVDGLPLAIEIMAAQTRVESVSELEVNLAERLPNLPAVARDVPERQRTMEAAIGWSLARLDAESRAAFGRLAVFAGGFDTRGAAAVLERGRPATLTLLGELLDASLLVRHAPAFERARFRMLEPLRGVADTHMRPRSQAAVTQRHAAFMVAEVERLCPAATGIQRPEDLAQLRLAHPDLIKALNHLARTAPNAAVDLLVQLHTYWIWIGGEVQAGEIAGSLLVAGTLDSSRTCDALLRSAYGANRLGAIGEAVRMIDEALAISKSETDQGLLARVRLYEAVFARNAGDRVRGAKAAQMAAIHARRAGDLQFTVWAEMLMDTHDVAASRRRLEGALSRAEAHSLPLVQTALLESLGRLYVQQSELRLARDALTRALGVARQFSAPAVAARFENNLGTLLLRQGSVEEARLLLLSSLTTRDRIGWRASALYPLSGLAEAGQAAGHSQDALVLFAATRAIAASHGFLGFLNDDPDEQLAVAAAEENLGLEAAAEARAAGERMTYREAVDFAFEINGVTPP